MKKLLILLSVLTITAYACNNTPKESRIIVKNDEANKKVDIIIDHPGNPGYPTYWHARTYGLFAANPLGEAIFTKGEKHFNFVLEPNESVTFKYEIAIKSGTLASATELNEMFDAFSKK